MKIQPFLLIQIFFFPSLISCNIYYIANNYLSCDQSCARAGFLCSNEMMKEMNCKTAAMNFCQTYMYLAEGGEISTQQPGCIVNCHNLAYLPTGERTCGLEDVFDRERSYIDGTSAIQICTCITIETEDSNILTYPIQVGLLLFLLSGIVYLGMGIYNLNLMRK